MSSLGVPPGLVALVAELHNGMGACVKYHGTLNDRFSTRTGVRQGAVEAPTLWDLYFHFVVQDWRARVETRWGAETDNVGGAKKIIITWKVFAETFRAAVALECFKGCSIAGTVGGPTSFRTTCFNMVLGQ